MSRFILAATGLCAATAVVLGLVLVLGRTSDDRAACERLGGVYLAGADPHVCLDRQVVIHVSE